MSFLTTSGDDDSGTILLKHLVVCFLVTEENMDNTWQAASLALRAFRQFAEHKLELINISENFTFRIINERGIPTHVLRVHRTNYHDRLSILSELAWINSLSRCTKVAVPKVVMNDKAQYLTETTTDDGSTRYCVVSQYVEGVELTDEDSVDRFHTLGVVAATLHLHTLKWNKPPWFSRFTWDLEDAFGGNPRWGPWSAYLDTIDKKYLHAVEESVVTSLANYGRTRDRFGLIHADMRLSNIIWSVNELQPTLIDFDDSGYGWFMYDLATTVSFFEHKEQVPDMLAMWLQGYESVRPLSQWDKGIIWSLVMFRRLLLLGWIQSHPMVPICQQLEPIFVGDTLALADRFLKGNLTTF